MIEPIDKSCRVVSFLCLLSAVCVFGIGTGAQAPMPAGVPLPAPSKLTVDSQDYESSVAASEDTPVLAWSDLSGETGYQWQVWTGVLCTGALAAAGSTGTDVTSAEVLPALAVGTYHWRVRGLGDGSSTTDGPWACGCPFTVWSPPCDTTVLYDPVIASDTTWDTSGSPYIVHGTLTVNGGATLGIDPGVIVKFDSGGQATVNGTLKVLGTTTDLVAFGSINDDSLCGPSDGGSGTPSPGDWNGITLADGSGGYLINALIRHASTGLRVQTARLTSIGGLTVERCLVGMTIRSNSTSLAVNDLTTSFCTVGLGVEGTPATAPVFTNYHSYQAPLVITMDSRPTFTGGVLDGGGILAEAGVLEYGWLNPASTPDPTFNGVTIQNMAPGGLPALRIVAPSPIAGSTHWAGVPFLLSGTVTVAPTGRVDAYDTTVYAESGSSARLDVSGTLNLGSAGTSTLLYSSSAAPAAGDWQGIYYLSGSQGIVRDTTIRHASWGLDIQTGGLTSIGGLTVELCTYGVIISTVSASPVVNDLTTNFCNLGLGIRGTAAVVPVFTNYRSLRAPLSITQESRPTFTGGVLDGGGVLTQAGLLEYGWLDPAATPDPTFNGVTIQNMAPGGLPALRILATNPIAGSTHWAGVPFILSGTVTVAPTARLDVYDTTVYAESGSSARLVVSGTLNLGSAGTSTLLRSSSAAPAAGDWQGIYYLSGSQGTVRDATIRHATWGLDIQTAGLTSIGGLTVELCTTGVTIGANGASPAVNDLTANLCYVGLAIQGTATTAPIFTNYRSFRSFLWISAESRPTFTGGALDGGGVLTHAGGLEYGWPGPPATPDPTFNGLAIQNMAPGGLPALRIVATNPIDGTTHWAGISFILTGTVAVASAGRVDAYDTTVYAEVGTNAHLSVAGILNLGSSGTSTLFRSSSPTPGPGDWIGIYYEPGSSGFVKDTTVRHAHTGIMVETANPFTVARATFEQNNTGLYGFGASTPGVEHCSFTGNQVGVAVGGASAPDLGFGARSSQGSNTLIGTAWSVQNLTSNPISAQYNWWGCPTTAEMDAGNPIISLIYDHAFDPSRGAVDYQNWFGGSNRSIRAARDTAGGARDVLLTWLQEPTGTLRIMRGTTPDALGEIGTTSGASWRDVGALDAPGIYYYLVDGPCP